MKINYQSGRNDSIPWWGPITIRNRRIKAEEEAQIVRERFGHVGRVDRPTKERIADLINQESIDLVYFESEAGIPNEHGIRPSLAALRAKREQEMQHAVVSAMTKRLCDSAGEQQPFETTHSGTGEIVQSSMEAQIIDQDHKMEELHLDSANANDTFAADVKLKEDVSYELMDTQRENSEISSETVGRDETREDAGTTDDKAGLLSKEAQVVSPELDVVAVTSAPSEMFGPGLSRLSSVVAKENSQDVMSYQSRTRDSATLEEHRSMTDISGIQPPAPGHAEAPIVPQFIQVESQKTREELWQSSPHITIPDLGIRSKSSLKSIPRGTSTVEGGSIANPKGTPNTPPFDTLHQGPAISNTDPTAQNQELVFTASPPVGTVSQGPTSSNTNLAAAQAQTSAFAAPTLSLGTMSHRDRGSAAEEPILNDLSKSPPAVPFHPAIPPGWNQLKWAYRTHTVADFELQHQGIWLYDRPKTFLSHSSSEQRLNITTRPRITVVRNAASVAAATTPSFVCNSSTLVLNVHQSPWPNDPRSTEQTNGLTPNSLFYTRLTEYQALEALGKPVWRHDRNLLPCHNPSCSRVISDMVVTTLICLTCGPKSRIRYCSPDCYNQDLCRHSMECGSDQYLIDTIVDDATAPPRFSHLLPSIRERNGLRNFHLHRQRVHAQVNGGRYTLFNPASGEPTALCFDYQTDKTTGKEAPYRGYLTEMEARVERCMNIALYDHTQTLVVDYLARLVQQCLHIKGAWNPALARVLAGQLAQEFAFDVRASWRNVAAHPLCECEWAGDEAAAHRHVPECILRSGIAGEVFRGRRRCLKDLVEAMEARHWILRAWRTQHLTESDGRRLVMGHGFPGCVVPEGWMPKLGRGWQGIWSGEDDICE
ncbi:MAG: hypothetical protein Q9216_006225 [Gyalolechia sp. 2 TL-2023]